MLGLADAAAQRVEKDRANWTLEVQIANSSPNNLLFNEL
jgi:hypothetical protein